MTRKRLVLKWGPECTHRTGQGWITDWNAEKVAAAPDPIAALASYAQQRVGIPFPTLADLKGMRRIANQICDQYPTATPHTLCRVVDFARARRKRCRSGSQLLGLWRDAMAAGYLNELDPSNDQALIDSIYKILENETEPRWRSRLMACADNDARRLAIKEWHQYRSPIRVA